ncbi:o-succinylbenzoate synthase [Picrophilus oshimae DSM 9789]|uniref:O-succinylbenzoate synthase n=2 Tax=Picrophilus oshimae TaxID=46632 RepID=A0A8G2L8F9_PICTO|nr:o-succinylbenzoate synthase [Picrophilus oshimae DSM 9789]
MLYHIMIEEIKFKRLKIGMKKPFVISLGSTDYYDGFIVEVTADGITGYGEAVPTPMITGDTAGSIEYELSYFSKNLTGMDENPEMLNDFMKRTMVSSRASRNAIDTAIYDIISKRAGMPLKRMLGGHKKRIMTSFTVDLVDSKSALKEADDLINDGVKVFKIKLGSGIDNDVDRVKTVRDAIGNDKIIYVDMNQAYNCKQALRLSNMISKYEIEFIEQPVNEYDYTGLKCFKKGSFIPVMVDESVKNPENAAFILKNELADMVNIKLMKSGGITDAVKISDICDAYNIPVMIGCMVETKVSISYGIDLALGRKIVKYADLDGFSSLNNDITKNSVIFNDGYITNHDIPGAGFELADPKALGF